MERYDYRQAVRDDVREWIEEDMQYRGYETFEEYARAVTDAEEDEDVDEDAVCEELGMLMWCADSVTGNASGSYTFSSWEAEENLCHNFDLLKEACEDFCCEVRDMPESAEAMDVTIRCYLLGEAVSDVVEEFMQQ